MHTAEHVEPAAAVVPFDVGTELEITELTVLDLGAVVLEDDGGDFVCVEVPKCTFNVRRSSLNSLSVEARHAEDLFT